MNPIVFWISLAIIFIIMEMFTATFFILCFSIGAFVVFLMEIFMKTPWDGYFYTSNFLIEIIVFAIVSGTFMIFLPKWLNRKPSIKTSIDSEIGIEVKVFDEAGNKTIKIEGQNWRIKNEDEFEVGESGKIENFEGTKVVLKKV